MINFNQMNISDNIKSALGEMGFESPTPIQDEVIPLILEGKDVIAQAPTGTGKTCAFGIPVINNIDSQSESIQALILCPTRELVIQTQAELSEVAKFSENIRIVSIYGGQNFDRQLAGLRKRPQIIIGTTGRVMDHLRRKSLKLANLKILILDEVDEMLNMGFREDIDVILESVPKIRQTVLFSATMPKEIVDISRLYQIDPISIKTQHKQSDIPNINQYYLSIGEGEKVDALVSVIREKDYKLVLVFCNTKKRVDELCEIVNKRGINADGLHGDLRQHQRDRTMKRFRGGDIQMLIATDVAARGIDVDDIDAVFNFDVPHDEEYYVHRIGRTSRAKKVGDAYTFLTEKQIYAVRNFESYTKNPILKYDYMSKNVDKGIDKKLFEKTLKLVKKADLTTVKEFLRSQLDELGDKYPPIMLMDIAAALLFQLNQDNTAKDVVMSEPPRLTLKQKRMPAKNRNSGLRFFVNIGTRDKCDEEGLKKFITSKTVVAFADILDVKCLESYSFVNVTENLKTELEGLNGIKFNKRIVVIEPASKSRLKPQGSQEAAREMVADVQKKGNRVGNDKARYFDKPNTKKHAVRPFEKKQFSRGKKTKG